MGIFSKTDEELKEEERLNKYRSIVYQINESNINDTEKKELIKRIIADRDGKESYFDSVDTLKRVISIVLETNCPYDLDEYFDKAVEIYQITVPKGIEDYEYYREKFIQIFLQYGGIENDLFNDGMYAVFADKKDYFEIMDHIIATIRDDDSMPEEFESIIKYINKVGKYCLDQGVLKRDVIAYIDGIKDVVDEDYDKYYNEALEEAKERIGIYRFSPKELAKLNSTAKKVESYLTQTDQKIKQLKLERTSLEEAIESGKADIEAERKTAIDDLIIQLEASKKDLLKGLSDYVLGLESSLNAKADETFREILKTYQEQIDEYRNIFRGYSEATTRDLITIQKSAEESIKRIKDYVKDDPALGEVLSRVGEQEELKKAIVELHAKKTAPAKEEVVLPGYSRIMVPYRHLVLPETIRTDILPSLDERIPFSKRRELLDKEMEKRIAEGEIFHSKVKEIAIDIMEGDWPYLWGPSGTGKSYIGKQVAEILGLDLQKAGKITEPYSILGYNDPQGRFQITPTFVAALYGNLLLLDEFDNGNPDTQVVLNDIYSELLNKIEEPTEVSEVTFGTDIPVDINPNFRMLSCGNTPGLGENDVFSSRGKIDESILQRMTPKYIDYDGRVEEKIFGPYKEWYEFFTNFRNACSEYAANNGLASPEGTASTRDAAAIRKYIDHNSKSIDQIMDERFTQTKDREYSAYLGRKLADIYGIDYDGKTSINYQKPLDKATGPVLVKKFIASAKKGNR